ncbi:MAG TPA: hypothetical protein VL860_03070 [Planctomycetota bacterium]|nr:hypothetical protein [Planctomycetota bacterium]
MNLSTRNAWILTGALGVVFLGAYAAMFAPEYSTAAKHRSAAQQFDKDITANWVQSKPDAVAYDTVEAEIENRKKMAYEDINQVFNVPVNYQNTKGANPSNYFGNQLDSLKKSGATKGLVKDLTKWGFDRLDPDNKYPIELKLRHLAMVDRLCRAAAACDLQEVLEFTQSSGLEVQPGDDEAAGPAGTRGRRPGMGGETAGNATPVAQPTTTKDEEIRLVKVQMGMKFRGREGDIVKFLALIQAPSKDPTELTMVYLNSAILTTNDKTIGTLDGDIQVSAIFPIKGADLESVKKQQDAALLTILK